MVELTSSATYRHGSRSGRPPFARRFWPIHHRQRIRLWGMAFVLPTLLFFAVFKYGPMVWAIELSFNSYDMVSQPHFVGLDNYRALAAARRYVIVICFVLGAILTTPEVITQVLMAIPLLILYEISVWVAWYWERQDKKLEEAERARET